MIFNVSDSVTKKFLVASNVCNDLPPTTSTTTTTTTNPPVTCNQGWIGDGYCDPQNNFAECQWDGNDCCNNSNPGWNSYCGNVSSDFQKKASNFLHCDDI